MNFANVKALTIPVNGTPRDVKSISIGGSIVWTKPNPLPYDAEVEYLQASGGPYIDTGIDTTGITRVALKMEVVTRPTSNEFPLGEQGYFGSTAQRGRIMLCVYASSNASNLAYGDFLSAGRSIYSLSNLTITIDKSFTAATPITNTQRILVFRAAKDAARVTPTDVFGGVYNLYYLKLWNGDDLIRDYIPVRVGTTGALYDRANPTGGPNGNGMYYNAGSGNFTLGPDKTT